MVAIHVTKANTDTTFFVYTDYLGSLRCITDSTGTVRQRLGFDAWGNRRNPITGLKDTTLVANLLFARGFTGHEHIDELGLINMNGRVYDPTLGVFISADNFVQAPDFTQSFNRYAYCLNNPLSFTDPTGNTWLSHLTGWIGEQLSSVDPTMNGTITNNIMSTIIKIDSWFMTSLPSTIDAIYNGNLSRLDPFNKGTISNNSARITTGLFKGSPKQILSRFTWELPQTITGLTITHSVNYLGKIKNVDYFYGATLVNRGGSGRSGMTMGSYILGKNLVTSINANSTPEERRGFYMFVHEYGHYMQSQANGPSYLLKYGLPSFVDQVFRGSEAHDNFWVEIDANTRGFNFFSDPSIVAKTGFNSNQYINRYGYTLGNTRNTTWLDWTGMTNPSWWYIPLISYFE